MLGIGSIIDGEGHCVRQVDTRWVGSLVPFIDVFLLDYYLYFFICFSWIIFQFGVYCFQALSLI